MIWTLYDSVYLKTQIIKTNQTNSCAKWSEEHLKIAPRNFWSDENILCRLEWQLHSHLHLSNIIELSIQHENMSLKLNYTSVKLT